MWLWIGVGLAGFFALSALMGLALAAMLGSISQGVAELHEELFEFRPEPAEPRLEPRRRRRVRRPLDDVTAHALYELEHP